MSQSRQIKQADVPVGDLVDRRRPVIPLARDYPHGHIIRWHRHRRAQLVFAASGVMTVTTAAGTWVVPPQRAVWVPSGVEHQIKVSGALAMRTLYIALDATPWLPTACRVVTVSPLLRELILHAITLPESYAADGPEARLLAVLLDQIRTLPAASLHLPLPQDRRLQHITDALLADPGDGRTLQAWGREVGASTRTLARLFLRETEMTFRQWRRQLRLLTALEHLATGRPVTQVALEVGYDSPSAFITMFRRALGTTPSHYFLPYNASTTS